jgi:hypothetical protein
MPTQMINPNQVVTTGVSNIGEVYNQNTNTTSDAMFSDPEKTKVAGKYPIYKNCYKLDEQLKQITDELAVETKKLLENKGNSLYVRALQGRKSNIEYAFTNANCSTKIETDKLKETAIIETQGAISQEQSVLGKSKNEQNIYIGVGAVIVLVGLYMYLKK